MLEQQMQLERKAIRTLASLFSLRMLGLFMILPVFALYAKTDYSGANALLIGLALGIYGATSGVFQLVLGWASDHFGRKPMIALGLLLFAVGSIIAGASDSIYGVIAGRALQGAGAIGSVMLALIADLTREETRTKAMAIIGMSIGGSFVLAIVLGPFLVRSMGLSGVFYLTAIAALVAILVLWKVVPAPKHSVRHLDQGTRLQALGSVFASKQLLRLDWGILSLHAALTMIFLVVPIDIRQVGGAVAHQSWLLYLPALFAAFICMVPLVIIAEKYQRMKAVFCAMIGVLILAIFVFWHNHNSSWHMALGLFLFFMAFTVLEATLPSLISKIAPVRVKGTAMGVYSSSQYLGAFIGGAGGGLVLTLWGSHAIFMFAIILLAIWLGLALTMAQPPYLSTKIFSLVVKDKSQAHDLVKQIQAVKGVVDVEISLVEQAAYVKVQRSVLDEPRLMAYATGGSES